MGKPVIIWINWVYRWIRRPNVSYSMCNCCGATTTANGRFLRLTAFYNKKFLISGGCKVGVENFCTKLPKGTPLRRIWSNKSFGVCGSDVVLTLYGGEKKVRENRHWKIESYITLRRCRDVVIGRSRLQHLPFKILFRHQLQIRWHYWIGTFKYRLKTICLRQHTAPRTVWRYYSASDSRATRAL